MEALAFLKPLLALEKSSGHLLFLATVFPPPGNNSMLTFATPPPLRLCSALYSEANPTLSC